MEQASLEKRGTESKLKPVQDKESVEKSTTSRDDMGNK